MVKRFIATIGLALAALTPLAGCATDLPAATAEQRYTTAASQFIQLSDGVRLHVRDEGKRDGPVLVLVHGSNGSLQSWEPWVAQLKATHRVISMDLPAHGLTGPNASRTYNGATYVRVIDELVTHLGIDRFFIAGNSMGGAVAWRYALAHPAKLEGMILVDAAGYPREGEGASNSKPPLIFRLVRTPGVGEMLSMFTTRSLLRSNLHEVFVEDSKVTDAMVNQYYDLLMREGNRQATLDRMRAAPDNPDAWRQIATITTPTLIQWGDGDAWIPVSDAARFGRDLANSRTVIYSGVGHLPQEEAPVVSARDAAAFVAAVRAGTFTPAPAN
jgi:pimeloyl-ACP methyl ester carboxylesterase